MTVIHGITDKGAPLAPDALEQGDEVDLQRRPRAASLCAGQASRTPLPFTRMTTSVEHPANSHCGKLDDIVHRKGKSLQEPTSQGAMHDSTSLGDHRDLLQRAVKIDLEFPPES